MQYQILKEKLMSQSYTWLITGVSGFIGSNLLETLLKLNQQVIGLDNFSTGHEYNLQEVKSAITKEQWQQFNFIKGDIRSLDDCRQAVNKVDFVLHQAALGSVPRSIKDPIPSHDSNLTGFLNILSAARDAGVKRFVYASSSSVYGDRPELPKQEANIGKPLSPYALTKYVNELYADVFQRCYNFNSIGLRYFNVFGKRQDPNGAYAAVIPKWVSGLINSETIHINGDGETSRDFCFIDNVVQANLLAATIENPQAVNQVYNVAVNQRTTLNELFAFIRNLLSQDNLKIKKYQPVYGAFRAGDVHHSLADIHKIQSLLGYDPTHDVRQGLVESISWYKYYFNKKDSCA